MKNVNFKISISLLMLLLLPLSSHAQVAPSVAEITRYSGLHKAAHEGDLDKVVSMIAKGASLEETDGSGRTPLHIAAFASNEDIVETLAKAGSNMNALEHQAYDIITIAVVANDIEVLEVALQNGADPSNVTSPYDGTALIAAAHLGHHEVVKMLIDAGAPLDHINNLGWTALIESVILGNGGKNHQLTAKHLVEAGADKTIADENGETPLQLARYRGYDEMVKILSGNLD